MRRRHFIRLLAGAAVVRAQALPAQQIEHVPRVGVLIPYLESDTEAQGQMVALRGGLEKLGLIPERSVRIDERWTAGDFGILRRAAKELVTLRPDVIISRSTAATAALLYETRTTPVVFLLISDPVGDGFVVSMARPVCSSRSAARPKSSAASACRTASEGRPWRSYHALAR